MVTIMVPSLLLLDVVQDVMVASFVQANGELSSIPGGVVRAVELAGQMVRSIGDRAGVGNAHHAV